MRIRKYNKMVASNAFKACKIGDIEALKKLPHVIETFVDGYGANCLHYAARGGSLVVVEYLVKSLNFSVLTRTKTGATALHDAAAKGNTAVVKWLVECSEVNVDERDGAGITALHLAARYGHFLTVEWLLDEASADASIRSSAGALPLHFAVVGGSMDCVKILVDENPRLVNMQMNNGAAPVYLASQAGNLDILQYLISRKGATKVNAYDAMSSLHAAAQMGHLEVVKWLVKVDKCNPNERDFDGNTPLHFAAGRGHAEVVRWLLKYGGARVTLDNLGGSPLHTAAELGQFQCIQALLECGCDVTLTDNAGLTAAELADKCDQTQAAALIRGEVTLAQLSVDKSENNQTQPQHLPHSTSQPPLETIQTISHTTGIKANYPQTSPSPPPPPLPAHPQSIGSTPSSLESPISPPTPIYEDENDPVSALGYGYGSVNPNTGGVSSSSEQPTIRRTVSRVSVDSSASNFGVFEQKDAGVIHTVTAEVHKAPKVVPSTPRPVFFPAVPGRGSLNSTQESIIYSTSSSSFSQDEFTHGLDKNLVGQKVTRISTNFSNKQVPEFHNWDVSSPPLAHSTLSNKKTSPQSDISTESTSSTLDISNLSSHPEEVRKFQYYSTPYKEDFNTVTRSSFLKAKALFQYNQLNSPQICPDSGEICNKVNTGYKSSSFSKMDSPRDQKPEKNHEKSVEGINAISSSNSGHTSHSQNSLKSIITIDGKQATIITTGNSPIRQPNSASSSAANQREQQVKSDNAVSLVKIHKEDMMQELRSRNTPQITNSVSTNSALGNGHLRTNTTNSNHATSNSASSRVPVPPQHLPVNGDGVREDDISRSPRNFSRSSSASSVNSQTFSPVESKHNLIADIQSAVSGASNLSLRRAKGRGEGVSMVYQSKKGATNQTEVKADHSPLSGQFDPKNFIDKVEKVDSSGRMIPEWRRHVLAKHLAEKAQAEYEERKLTEDYEARFKDVPAWKRALIERRDAQAREEAASNKK